MTRSYTVRWWTAYTAVCSTLPIVRGFSTAVFPEAPTLQKTAPSTVEGLDIELPDFDELFDRIQQVSPLARQVIARRGSGSNEDQGFEFVNDKWPENLVWQRIESNKRKGAPVSSIEKIENFQGHNAPLLRFRASMQGPCIGEPFANFIMSIDERKKWDSQIAQVYEVAPIHDLDAANIAMGFGRYGDCSRLGIGYCQTKANIGISAREQLSLCGIQDFDRDGSSIIWGVEMEERHDHLFPKDTPRTTRAKTRLFSTTLTPTGDDTFDVEYCLQLDPGGSIPRFLTTPVMIETVKSLFRTAKQYYDGSDALKSYLEDREQKKDGMLGKRQGLLMTP